MRRRRGQGRFAAVLVEASRRPNVDQRAVTLCVLMWQLSEEISGSFERFFAHSGLSRSAYGVLSVLRENGPVTPVELARSLGATKSSMTGLLDTLSKRGLILRRPSASDGRSSDIRLAKRAEVLLEHLIPRHLKHMEQIFDGVSEDDLENAARIFAAVQLSVARARARSERCKKASKKPR